MEFIHAKCFKLVRNMKVVQLTYIAARPLPKQLSNISTPSCIAVVLWFWLTYEVFKFPKAFLKSKHGGQQHDCYR